MSDAEFEDAGLLALLGAALGDLVEDVGQLLAEEDRDDRGRGLVGAEAVVVGRRGHRRAQQATVFVHTADDGRAEHQELLVLVRGVARIEQVALIAVTQREVDVLARTVDAGEGLLVDQTDHAVAFGDLLHRRHHQLLMIMGEIGLLEHRRQLELAGSDLVVPRLGRDALLEQLAVELDHERQHTIRDGPEVVVVELLALGRLGAEQGAVGGHQVGSGEIEMTVDQEVLLLGSGIGDDGVDVFVSEQLQQSHGLLAHGLLAAQQRCLLVQGLTGPRDEDRGNAQRVAVGVLEDVGGLVTSHPV